MKLSIANLVASLFTLAFGSLAYAAPPVVTHAEWLGTPDAETFARAYPALATQLSIEGLAILHCHLGTDGKLSACKVSKETPVGLGFGDAALSITGSFVLRPGTVDGRPVEDDDLNIPIQFRLPSPQLQFPESPPSTSPTALALAHDFLAARGGTGAAEVQIQSVIREFDRSALPGLSQDVRRALVTGLRESSPKWIERVQAETAKFYAGAFTEDQLKEMVEFLRSPAGQAFALDNEETRATYAAIEKEYRRLAALAGGTAFCARRGCLNDDDARAFVERSTGSAARPNIAMPSWSRQPSAGQIEDARPSLATNLHLGGAARLTCVTGDLGSLSQCIVDSETPAGLGFGGAATRLKDYFQLDPASAPGVAGKAVALIVQFPKPGGSDERPIEDYSPRSRRAMALARELVAAQDARRSVGKAWIDYVRKSREPLSDLTEADWTAAMEDISKGTDIAKTRTDELKAAYETTYMTDADLAAAVRFATSPAGVAWKMRLGEIAVRQDEIGRIANALMWQEVGQTVCLKIDCGASQ